MEQKSSLLFALFDEQTGEVLVAHPTKKDVFVTHDHFKELVANAGNKSIEQNCVYTEQQVCTAWAASPSSYSGQICTNWATVRTCRCT